MTEEALVYSRPDFDAKVIGQLKAGRPVKVSKGTTGEVAKFHKIRIGKTIGYIAEIDVRIEGASKRKVERTQGQDGSRRSRTEATPEASRQRFPIYFSRYFGLIGGMADFKESIPGVDARANLLFYGLKITGPDVIIEGPIIDFNLALHYGAPSYYEPLSTIKPTGFVMWADALLLIPFAQRDDWMIYLGAGPLVTLSKFNVISTGRPMNLMSLDAGVAVSIGGAFRVEKVALRLEGKYLFEKTSYTVFQASLQTEF